jgi:hypothetical protein
MLSSVRGILLKSSSTSQRRRVHISLRRLDQVFRTQATGNLQRRCQVFSPSLEASLLKVEHMMPFLNHLNVDVAYGRSTGYEIPASQRES